MRYLTGAAVYLGLLALTATPSPHQPAQAQDTERAALTPLQQSPLSDSKKNLDEIILSKQDEIYSKIMGLIGNPALSEEEFSVKMENLSIEYTKFVKEKVKDSKAGTKQVKLAENQIFYDWKTKIMNRLDENLKSPLLHLLGSQTAKDISAKARTLLVFGSDKNSHQNIYRKEGKSYTLSKITQDDVRIDTLNPLRIILQSDHSPETVKNLISTFIYKDNIYKYNDKLDEKHRVKPLSKTFENAALTEEVFKTVLIKDYSEIFQMFLENYEDLGLQLLREVKNPTITKQEGQFEAPVLEHILTAMKKFGDKTVTLPKTDGSKAKPTRRSYTELYMEEFGEEDNPFSADFISDLKQGSRMETIPNKATRDQMIHYAKMGWYRNNLLTKLATVAFNQGRVLDLIRYAHSNGDTQAEMLKHNGDLIIFGHKNSRKWNALMYSAFYKSDKEVKFLLAKSPSYISSTDAINNNVLHLTYNLQESWFTESQKTADAPMKSVIDFINYDPEEIEKAIKANLLLMKSLLESPSRKEEDKIVALKQKNDLGYTPVALAAALGYHESFDYLKNWLDHRNVWDSSEHDVLDMNIHDVLSDALKRRIEDFSKAQKLGAVRPEMVEKMKGTFLVTEEEIVEQRRIKLIKETMTALDEIIHEQHERQPDPTYDDLQKALVKKSDFPSSFFVPPKWKKKLSHILDVETKSRFSGTKGELPPPTTSSEFVDRRLEVIDNPEGFQALKNALERDITFLRGKLMDLMGQEGMPGNGQLAVDGQALTEYKVANMGKTTQGAKLREILLQEMEKSHMKDLLVLAMQLEHKEKQWELYHAFHQGTIESLETLKENLAAGEAELEETEQMIKDLSEAEAQILDLLTKVQQYTRIGSEQNKLRELFPIYRPQSRESKDFDILIDSLSTLVKKSYEFNSESLAQVENCNSGISMVFEEITDVLLGEKNDLLAKLAEVREAIQSRDSSRREVPATAYEAQVAPRFAQSETSKHLSQFKQASLKVQKPYLKNILRKLLDSVVRNNVVGTGKYSVDEMLKYLTTGPDGKPYSRPQINDNMFASGALKKVVEEAINDYLLENDLMKVSHLTEEERSRFFERALSVEDKRHPQYNLLNLGITKKFEDSDESDSDHSNESDHTGNQRKKTRTYAE